MEGIRVFGRRVEEVMASWSYGKSSTEARADSELGEIEERYFYRRFTLGRKIAQGTAANIFEGKVKRPKNGEAERRYAIKRVWKWQLKDQRKRNLLLEVYILSRLEHPNVVSIHRFYPWELHHYYIVLESLTGGELFDRIVKKESYNEREVRDVCKVLVDVVGHLHDRSIVHRHLRPGNILLASKEDGQDAACATTSTTTKTTTIDAANGTTTTTEMTTTVVKTIGRSKSSYFRNSIKITGFGMARSVCDGPVTSSFPGKTEFSAPEMLLGKPHGKPVDMWSLGVIAYILLSGYHPFFERDAEKMYLRVAAGDCQFKPSCWANISKEAKDFIRKLLTVEADSRLTARQAKSHPWLLASDQSLEVHDLRGNLEEFKLFNAKRKLRAATKTALAAKRMMSFLAPAPVNISKSYALGEKLGEGAFGEVFKAVRVADGACSRGRGPGAAAPRYVAVKRIAKEGLDERAKREVINEATVMRGLNHPNVVSIYDFYEDDSKYFFMILELMEGGELFNRIVKKEYYNEAEARDVCCILLGAVKYIHSRGIVHRDLKPENLLLASSSDDTSIRLADFGFASSVYGGLLVHACGTPAYLAPEMLMNVPYGTSVDMWSVGVIIYVLLAGYPPFHNRDQAKMFRAIKRGQFMFHEEYWGEVSADAKDLVSRLLTVKPEERITASEACQHAWLSTAAPRLSSNNLSAGLEQLKLYNAKRKFRVAIQTVVAAKKLAGVLSTSELPPGYSSSSGSPFA